MAYIVVFVISIFLGFLADKNKKYAALLMFFSMLPPLVLGAIRSPLVGTDNYCYFEPIFNMASNYGSFAYFMQVIGSNEYVAYSLFYYISRFIKDYHAFCFISTLISLLFTYIAIYRERKNINIWMSLTVYFFIFYCPMLCYVRQSMALAICLFAMYYVHEKKYFIFILLVVFAALFHTTALVFLLYAVVYIFLKDNTNSSKRIVILFSVALFAMLLYVKFISEIFDSLSFLTGHFEVLAKRYMTDAEGHGEGDVRHVALMIASVFPPSALALVKRKLLAGKYVIIFVFVSMACICEMMTYVDMLTARLAFYFLIPSIFLLSNLSAKSVIVSIGSLFYVLMYWIIFVVMNKINFTYPVFPYITDVL